MKLTRIFVHPNPFMPAPSSPPETTSITPLGIPTLREFCMRKLVVMSRTPAQAGAPESQFEVEYGLPTRGDPATFTAFRALGACIPGSVAESGDDAETDDISGVSVCPSPLHQGEQGEPLFVEHAVERFVWADHASGWGGKCPVRWRGCQRGCLDFLEPLAVLDEEASHEGEVPPIALHEPGELLLDNLDGFDD